MPRNLRVVPPDGVLHVLNRANRRAKMFASSGDYARFAELLAEGLTRTAVPLYAYCLMPNHWHLVLRAADGKQLAGLMHWVTTKHANAWNAYRGMVGEGHLYQGRYKAFPVQADEHFLVVCRYVERNPLRAGLVERASDWTWSSHRAHIESGAGRASGPLTLTTSPWPVERPANWQNWVDLPQSDTEVAEIRTSLRRGAPFGAESWREEVAAKTGRKWSLPGRGRPRGKKSARHLFLIREKKVPDPFSA
jgi:putative transposase